MKSTTSISLLCKNGVGIALVVLLSVTATFAADSADLTITKQQYRILLRFKDRVLSKLPDEDMKHDLYLLRWLRVKDFNLDLAEQALMENIIWRKNNRMNEILDQDFTEMHQRYPYWIRGEDKQGRPLVYFDLGGMDLRQVVIKGETNKFNRYIDSAMEKAYRTIRHLQDTYQNVTQCILMINVDEYNLVEHGCAQCIPLILRAVQTYEHHYPGYANKIIILNVPQDFQPLLTAARNLLSRYTDGSLNIFGKNRREWSAFLGKHFDWNQLPTTLGGTDEFPEDIKRVIN